MPPELPRPRQAAGLPDLQRHRKEIEEMEQRFRKRSDAPFPEPPASGPLDEQVQQEMRQFFSESAQILEEVVPSLKRDDDHLADTTGEIRRKIDAFFGDSGASGMLRAERTMPIGALDLPTRPAPERRPPPRLADRLPPPMERGGPDARPQPPRPRPESPAWEQDTPSQAPGTPAAGPSRRPPPRRAPAEGAPLDLKTALERLRRHGVVKEDAPPPAAAQRPYQDLPAAAPAVEPRPRQDLRADAPPVPARPRQEPPAAAPPSAPRLRREFPAPPPERIPEPHAAAPLPPPPSPAPPPAVSRFEPPPRPPVSDAPPVRLAPLPDEDDPFAPPPLPPQPLRSAPSQPLRDQRPPEPRRERDAYPPPRPAQAEIPRVEPLSPARESAEAFDAIFAEVEGLVRGTLADSIQETMEEARVTEGNMRSLRKPPTTAPVLSAKLPPPREDEEEGEPVDEAPAGPYDWGVSAASRPAGAWLLEEGAEEKAVSQVRARARGNGEITGVGVGEWSEPAEPEAAARKRPEPAPRAAEPRLAREPEKAAPMPPPVRAKAPVHVVDDDDPPAPRPAPEESGDGGGGGGGGAVGATGLLARKLEAEAARLGPVVDRLVKSGVLDAGELSDDEFDDEEEVSVASFKDDRPRGEAMNVTPMRIVEEIRRLRRIQDILMSKGLVSEDELDSAAPSDG